MRINTFKTISRVVREEMTKKQQFLKNKKSNRNRFLLSIIKKLVKYFFTEISKDLLFSLIKDKLKDLFDFSNDSPIIDYVHSLFSIKSTLIWLIDFVKSFIEN
ncbi:hypothetical protein [Chryseobacterium kwangjuense]|uniref:Uncharacterized protein n=1 Tax=Chryseobacterium kwangjuense TaxID=267125 RepID=A0A135WLQ7_9FLAO|nr:hypothetical protein [Chryseobacterium kwangjuense]KXH85825.1 hypothetical protein AU378_08810 [Chryseobacterium kwangjuense]